MLINNYVYLVNEKYRMTTVDAIINNFDIS